ncbi:MAG: DNA polymerase I, partial [Planctomycetia bacterium]|nr:DNA polymerase I [Planctomycetia bacterium]
MDLTGKRVFVVDAYGLIYQRFHAMPSYMTGRNGEPVNAIYGFIQDLFILLEEQNVDFLFCAFDLHAPTFRSQVYTEYKATREKMPEELIAQIPKIKEILETLQIPMLALEGYEADDILATVSRMTSENGGNCVLVTSDKDSRQLITDTTTIFNMRRNIYLDRAYIIEDWGIEPEQVVDYQALVGDSADNVPGIALIGPKAAKELLNRFGTLENILKPENLMEFYGKKPSKRRDNLLNGVETAIMCQNLVRLDQHIPITVKWEEGATEKFDFGACRPLLDYYQFRSLIMKAATLGKKNGTWTDMDDNGENLSVFSTGLGEVNLIPGLFGAEKNQEGVAKNSTEKSTEIKDSAISENKDSSLIITSEGSETFYNSVMNHVTLPIFKGSFDAESFLTQKLERKLILPPILFTEENFAQLKSFTETEKSLGFENQETQADLFGFFNEQEKVTQEKTIVKVEENQLELFLAENREALEDSSVLKIGFNLKRVRNWLRRAGFSLHGPQFDVMVAAYILEPDGRHATLGDLAENCPEAATVSSEITESDEIQTEFLDKLFRIQIKRLKALNLDPVCFCLEFPLIEVLAEMEFQGIYLNKKRMAEISRKFQQRIDTVSAELYRMADEAENAAGMEKRVEKLNLNSTPQLRKLLFETMKLTSSRKTKTGLSTDAQTLEELSVQHPFPARLLEYRQMVKLQNTYVEALPKLISTYDGRIHTTFNQTVTATGRLSSSDPNLQNIPVRSEEGKLIRSAFMPEKTGWAFVSADYSQIELRVLAHYCGDENLCEAFQKDQDIHARVASQIHGIPLEEVTSDMRRAAKTVNFGVIYGQSSYGLAGQLKIPQGDARDFIHAYFRQFPAIPSFLDTVLEFARLNGYVQTIFGRRRALKGIRQERRGQLNGSERMAVNTVIQGSAADLIKLAMLRVYARLQREALKSRLLLQIHDELLLECPPEEITQVQKILEEEMTATWELSV